MHGTPIGSTGEMEHRELPGYGPPGPPEEGDENEEPPPPPPPDDEAPPGPPSEPPAEEREARPTDGDDNAEPPGPPPGEDSAHDPQPSEDDGCGDRPADDSTADVRESEAKGRGLGGGVATTEVAFRVEVRNRNGERLHRGGDDACAVVKGPGVAREITVSDNGDGTYEFKYSVPRRGDYRIHVFINGLPLAKSPQQAFFTAPPQAATSVKSGFNSGDSEAKPATVHVANISPVVSLDQLRKLFSFCGEVLEARFAPDGKNYAFIEFATHEAASSAFGLGGLQVGDRDISVAWSNQPRLVPPQGSIGAQTAQSAPTDPPVLVAGTGAASAPAVAPLQSQASEEQQEQQQASAAPQRKNAALTAQQRLEALNKRLGAQ